MPDKIIALMFLTEIKSKFGLVIGICFLVSAVIIFVKLLKMVYEKTYNNISNKRLKENTIKFLKELSNPSEIELLSEIINQEDYTLELPTNNGVVIKLYNYGIITPAGSNHFVEMDDPHIPYFLQPRIIRIIENDDELKKKFNFNGYDKV